MLINPQTNLPPIPPAAETFPSATSTTPFWRTPPHPLDTHRSTPTLPPKTDILIIGAGMTGISLAYHLLRSPSPNTTNTTTTTGPTPTITILEARQLSSGATGRNGGHAKLPFWHLQHLHNHHSAAEAAELGAFQLAHLAALKAVVDKEAIACELLVTRSFDVYMRRDVWERRVADVAALRNAGGRAAAEVLREVQVLDAKEWGEEALARITGVEGPVAGALAVPAVSLWPYRFVCGLAERILGEVNLQTGTKVVGVSEGVDGDGYYSVKTTERGEVRARKVVFATNAYTAGVVPAYEGVIVGLKGTACKVNKKGGAPRGQVRTCTYNIFKEDGQVDYLIHRADGGAVVGGAREAYPADLTEFVGTMDDATLLSPDKAREYFERRMETAWADWKECGVEIDKIWTGIMGGTPDGYPHIGAVPGKENQYICAGFNGAGMPHIFLSAEGLARMIRDGAAFEDVGIPSIFKASEERMREGWPADKFTKPKGLR